MTIVLILQIIYNSCTTAVRPNAIFLFPFVDCLTYVLSVTADISASSALSKSYQLKLYAEKCYAIWLGTWQQLLRLSALDKLLQLADGHLCDCLSDCPNSRCPDSFAAVL